MNQSHISLSSLPRILHSAIADFYATSDYPGDTGRKCEWIHCIGMEAARAILK
ncbi:hypothetical protein M378DRAFT_522901 [Amanita muscaria Koide BX008]|uniref:Uncharacterized protein n=1 Tax=Amanita muscaria (strain Koide BX008) TaxID=946122 RepID=A0A0C2SR08_AMAMK|nr:hypothetical protein M378DRAFT_522901 [Amanita muscaria Koide BX008]